MNAEHPAAQPQRDPACVERWPECESGAYDPRCCRFPKSCSCTSYPPDESPAAHTAPPVVSVTDSSKPDEHFVREAAVALLARDALVGHDSASAENAVMWARSFLDRNEQAAHDGDCTGAIHTCARCIADEALREASEIHDE